MSAVAMPETASAFEAAYQARLEDARALSARLEGPSLAEELAALSDDGAARVLADLSRAELAALAKHWPFWARPKQRPPSLPPHRILLMLAGRSFGKTRSAAERIRERVEAGARAIAIVGPKMSFIEQYMLGVEGEPGGLLNVFPESQRPTYFSSPKNVVRFHTGAVGYCVSAESPEFRGANLDTAYVDEIAQFRHLDRLWANLEMSTRTAAALPLEIIVTTTPLPMRFLRELVIDPDVVTLLGTSAENAANTDPMWLRRMQRLHGGTRLGRQELDGEILGDNPDSLFPSTITEATRVDEEPVLEREIVSVDPAIATGERNDQTGLITLGADARGHIFITSDLTGRHKPQAWGDLIVEAYEQRRCAAVVVERNRGGDLCEACIRASMARKRGDVAAKAIKIENVLATKGKYTRAEPVSSLHAQGMIHIVGRMPALEAEISEWNPRVGGMSPNRLDALVWGVFYLANLSGDKPDNRDTIRGLGTMTKTIARIARSLPPQQFGVKEPTIQRFILSAKYGKRTI